MQPSPPRRRHTAAFTLIVSMVTVLGACLIGLVLATSGAPGGLVVGTLLACLPVVPLVLCFLWLDRYEPEPRTLLGLGLAWGAFVATSSALVLQIIGEVTISADQGFYGAVVAPVTEEAAKGLFILLLLWFRRHELDGVLDGVVYAGIVGIGFAFTENILYLSAAYLGKGGHPGGIEAAIGLFIIRGIFSPFAHPLFTAFTGIGMGIAVQSRSRAVQVLAPVGGYLLAVLAHAAWNGSVFLGGPGTFVLTYVVLMVPAFLLVVGIAIWARRREGQVLTAALGDCARRGFIDPAEIPWLTRLSARRSARSYARSAGGPAAGRAMADYQQAAIELGFLHHRYLRGTAPTDFAARGQVHVDAITALRPSLLWPGATGRTVTAQSRTSRTGGAQ